jgi:hypothetical protein
MLRVFPGKRCVKLRYPAPGGYVSASTALLSCSKVTIDEGESVTAVDSMGLPMGTVAATLAIASGWGAEIEDIRVTAAPCSLSSYLTSRR